MLGRAAFFGAIWLVLSRFLGRAIDFVNLLVLARLLTPADFGIAALATAFVMIIDTAFEVPITQALVRLNAIDRTHLDTGFTLSVIRSVIVSIIIVCGAWPYAAISGEPELFTIVCVLAIGPLAKGLASPAMVYFARDINFRPTFILEATGKLLALPVSIAIVTSGGGYWAIVGNFVSSALISSCLSYALARYRPAFSLERLRDFSSFMGWFSSSQLLNAFNWQYERLMIGYISPDKDLLGKYSVANDLSFIPSQSFIGPALQPTMSAFAKIGSDRERIRSAFLKAVRAAMLIGVPVSIGMALTADLITLVLLGPAWGQAGWYLMFFSLSVLPIPYFQAIYAVSLALDRPSVIFRLSIIDLSTRILLVTPGFYLYSIEGALIARLLWSATMFVTYMVQIRKFLEISVTAQLMNLWKIIFAGLVMTLCVWLFRQEVAPFDLPLIAEISSTIAVGGCTYGLSLIAAGVRLDLAGLRTALPKR